MNSVSTLAVVIVEIAVVIVIKIEIVIVIDIVIANSLIPTTPKCE